MTALKDAVARDPVAQSDLRELGTWPDSGPLEDVDLSLGSRPRVSALPWRGQFSPVTVERILSALAPPRAVILDPFVGSGTTLLEAARRGSPAIGFDINPAAIALARCACLASVAPEERDARLRQALQVGLAPGATAALADVSEIDEAHALVLLAHVEGSAARARDRLQALIEGLPTEPVAIRADLGDARATGLADNSVSFVVTSPPYINVFNYHQYGRPLSDGFGWPILMAARSEIGSNRQNRSNRFRTVIQYAIDMALAISEMGRVLTTGSTAVLVVGRESRVRGVPVYNGELLARLARQLGAFDRYERAERSFVSRFGECIFEDILVLSGALGCCFGAADAEQVGRGVGVAILQESALAPDTEKEIAAAVSEAERITPSGMSGKVKR
jgi:SAM-dependent methyltransferase